MNILFGDLLPKLFGDLLPKQYHTYLSLILWCLLAVINTRKNTEKMLRNTSYIMNLNVQNIWLYTVLPHPLHLISWKIHMINMNGTRRQINMAGKPLFSEFLIQFLLLFHPMLIHTCWFNSAWVLKHMARSFSKSNQLNLWIFML